PTTSDNICHIKSQAVGCDLERRVGMITVLAWMPLAASVTLSALLTAILLPAAILKARQSPEFAATTLLAVAMLWRGEAWKAVFLQSEQQVLELQQQQQPHTSSKTKYSTPD